MSSNNMMDVISKFNSQSAGRDRLFRLMQYGSRLIWAYLEKYRYDRDAINKLKNLEYSLSTARKLYRLGKSADILYGALNTLNFQDPVLRYTITLSRINMALYFLADHMLWIERVGLLSVNKAKWSRISYKLWLYYLVMNLARDLYEVLRIANASNVHYCTRGGGGGKVATDSAVSKLLAFYRAFMQHKDVAIDTLKNGCDVWIPLAQLGYVSLSPATIGLLGVISSLAGIFPLVDHTYKLLPM